MPHFMECLDTKCLGALHFTDARMQPKPREMTIKSVVKDRPPAAGKTTKPKWITYFEETDKGAFFSNTQYKKLANMLMCADPDGWVGAKITVTCAETRYAGQPVMGMIITKAVRPARATQQSAPLPRMPQTEEPSQDPDADEVNPGG
jgi:hypothetical protein